MGDAECFSASDREAILTLIGDWFTDKVSGESDAERLRLLGWHRFECTVRNEIALHVEKSGGGTRGMIQAWLFAGAIGIAPWWYDQFSSPDASMYVSVQQINTSLGMIVLAAPLSAWVFNLVVSVVIHLQSRGHILAFTVGSILTMFAYIVAMWAPLSVIEPQILIMPTWQAPDDGLDPSTRQVWKFQIAVFCHLLVVLFLLVRRA